MADSDVQTQGTAEADLLNRIQPWIAERIRELSVETIASGTFTCTACGEIEGDYIVTYRGQTLRFDTYATYAFLRYVTADQQ